MKRIRSATQAFSRAIIQPVMFMAVTGIVATIGAILTLFNNDALKEIGNFFSQINLQGVIGQLSVIFCVGLTTAMAKKKKTEAAIFSISIFMIYLVTQNQWMIMKGLLNESEMLVGTGQTMVLGFQVMDMGVFLGIMLGVIGAYIFNKTCDVEFNDLFSVFGGSRLSFGIMIVITIPLAIVFSYIWPWMNGLISSFAGLMGESGNIGLYWYNFLNRALIPTGMHHLVYMPFLLTPVAGSAEIAGTLYSGAAMIQAAQVADAANVVAIDPSVRFIMYGFGKIFGTIGIAWAFIKTAKPESRKRLVGILTPLVFLSAVVGLTEPFDFFYAFISPILFIVNSLLDALLNTIIYILGCRFSFAGGIFNSIANLFVFPLGVTKPYIALLPGIISIFVWYFVFKFLIVRLKIKIPDREAPAESKSTQRDATELKQEGYIEAFGNVNDIIEGLGGAENIETLNNCFSRLRIDIRDVALLKKEKINKFNNLGIIVKENNIQIVIGMKVSMVRQELAKILHID